MTHGNVRIALESHTHRLLNDHFLFHLGQLVVFQTNLRRLLKWCFYRWKYRS